MQRLITRAILPLTFLVILSFWWRMGQVSYEQLIAPVDLSYESPNVATVQLIRDGENPYDPALYNGLPFVFTMYTPLFHYLTACLPVPDDNPFFFGRLLSLAAMLSSVGLLFCVTGRRTHVVVPALLCALFFALWIVPRYSAYVKNDSLALLFSVAAVVLVSRPVFRWQLFLVALLCLLAIASKQSFVSATAACFFYFLLNDRRRAIRFAACYALLAGIGGGLATAVWGNGFWFCTVVATRNPFVPDVGLTIFREAFGQPLVVWTTVVTLLALISTARQGVRVSFQQSPFAAYLLASGLVLVLTCWKLGAADNYFIEFYLAQLLFLAFRLRARPMEQLLSSRRVVLIAALLVCAGLEWKTARWSDYSYVDRAFLQQQEAVYDQMNGKLAAASRPNPRILNLATHQDTYMMQDRAYLNDPYLYNILWMTNVLSPEPMVDTINSGYFDIIIATREQIRRPRSFENLLQAAILKNYRPLGVEPTSGYVIFARLSRHGAAKTHPNSSAPRLRFARREPVLQFTSAEP